MPHWCSVQLSGCWLRTSLLYGFQIDSLGFVAVGRRGWRFALGSPLGQSSGPTRVDVCWSCHHSIWHRSVFVCEDLLPFPGSPVRGWIRSRVHELCPAYVHCRGGANTDPRHPWKHDATYLQHWYVVCSLHQPESWLRVLHCRGGTNTDP